MQLERRGWDIHAVSAGPARVAGRDHRSRKHLGSAGASGVRRARAYRVDVPSDRSGPEGTSITRGAVLGGVELFGLGGAGQGDGLGVRGDRGRHPVEVAGADFALVAVAV